jgi:hypothetical protein
MNRAWGLVVVSSLALAIAFPAHAADLPLKAPRHLRP